VKAAGHGERQLLALARFWFRGGESPRRDFQIKLLIGEDRLLIALLGLLLTNEVRADCERCGDAFATCMANGGGNWCWSQALLGLLYLLLPQEGPGTMKGVVRRFDGGLDWVPTEADRPSRQLTLDSPCRVRSLAMLLAMRRASSSVSTFAMCASSGLSRE
jgi:hypothetical protein